MHIINLHIFCSFNIFGTSVLQFKIIVHLMILYLEYRIIKHKLIKSKSYPNFDIGITYACE